MNFTGCDAHAVPPCSYRERGLLRIGRRLVSGAATLRASGTTVPAPTATFESSFMSKLIITPPVAPDGCFSA